MENWNQDLPERYSVTAISADYIKNFVGMENGHGPGEVDGKVRVMVIGLAALVMESGGKHV